MTNEGWRQLYDQAIKWTKEAGEYIKKEMVKSFQISTKANQHDLVTDVDKGVEDFFSKKLNESYPEHRLMGEEGTAENIHDLKGTIWILDPIDGTVNFVHQESYFAISIGIYQEGVGKIGIVYDVMHDELFTALEGEGAYLNERRLDPLQPVNMEQAILSFNAGWILKDRRLEKLVKQSRGIRSYGAAALEMAYVAAGRLDAYISFNLAPWDIAGGAVIIKEVGGKTTNYEGEELSFLSKDTLLAASPIIHEKILSEIDK
ncbi:inositol monophosphatase family protein [Bacillus shivajii]|uniref:inositol monophosphatase family protein n=1 Tax=Bacillus shivajii TaxID=1983719 RepID=UPI001CFA7948|nr:inositol monophosphatase family protein [Bacillus shivajii]UCZ51875.1 inositol monophosphatase family protein [Bacillus shivajii]